MAPINRVRIATEIAEEDRALARELSESPLIGDPDTETLSDIEVQRAWQHLDSLDKSALPTLVRLSKRMGVPVPGPMGASVVDGLLGPPRTDPHTDKVLRRTRIVATVGPACADVDVLAKMITAGLDVARLNFSHIDGIDDARAWVDRLEAAMAKAGRRIEIMADLRGPKIRIAELDGAVPLKAGETTTLGEGGALPISPQSILSDLDAGERIFIDDGKIELEVLSTAVTPIEAKVVRGGVVRAKKGINLPDTKITARVPTEKDLADIATIQALGLSLVAVSFVEDGSDLDRVRAQFSGPVKLLAKVERPQAVANMESVFAASDGIMVARGDGAVEMGDAQMPVIQRQLHTRGNALNVPTGTATQMMESMLKGGRPSRSDASDVARAALEGSDFVMTSGETAMGKDPTGVITAMSKILETTERAIRTGTVKPPV